MSFADRGMRNDSHDAVAVVITPHGASQPVEQKRRRVDGSADRLDYTSPTSESDGSADTKAEVRQQELDLQREMREYWGNRVEPRDASQLAEEKKRKVAVKEGSDGEADDEADDEAKLLRLAQDLHGQMREYWDNRYG